MKLEGKPYPLSASALLELSSAVLERGGCFRFKANGLSMAPFIKDGDVLILSPFLHGTIGLGAVVGFAHPQSNKFIVHRVVSRKGGRYLVKGDNCFKPDGWVQEDKIVGYVSAAERQGRRIYFGLGPERIAIAALSRLQLIIPLIRLWRAVIPDYLRAKLLGKR